MIVWRLCGETQLSNEKKPSCLGYIGDYTTQLNGDHNTLLEGALVNNQDSMESKIVFRGSIAIWLLPATLLSGKTLQTS